MNLIILWNGTIRSKWDYKRICESLSSAACEHSLAIKPLSHGRAVRYTGLSPKRDFFYLRLEVKGMESADFKKFVEHLRSMGLQVFKEEGGDEN